MIYVDITSPVAKSTQARLLTGISAKALDKGCKATIDEYYKKNIVWGQVLGIRAVIAEVVMLSFVLLLSSGT
jgi:hypothetical protein